MDRADAASLDAIALSHGQARWVLALLGVRVGDSEDTFDVYLKSLRRDGVPFAPDELGVGKGTNLIYRYDHLMELAVALGLRAQAVLSRDIVGMIARQRDRLRPLLRRAYLERYSGLGALQRVVFEDETWRTIRGCYLDLGLSYADTGRLATMQVKLIGPQAAFDRFMGQQCQFYLRPPMPISDFAEDVVRLAGGAPEVRRGRPAG